MWKKHWGAGGGRCLNYTFDPMINQMLKQLQRNVQKQTSSLRGPGSMKYLSRDPRVPHTEAPQVRRKFRFPTKIVRCYPAKAAVPRTAGQVVSQCYVTLESSAPAVLARSLSHSPRWRVTLRGSESQQPLTQQGIVPLQVRYYVSLLFDDVFQA